jgi:aspartate aminotransferase-like enzyme
VNTKPRGRQFFNNPGPTNIPERVLRAMDRSVIDFMSDEFVAIQHACHAGVKRTFSAEGSNSQTSSAQRTSGSWLEPLCVPSSIWRCTASMTAGWL